MLAEFLVITACLQDKGGCTESTSAYYKYNKNLQLVVEHAEEYGKRIVHGNEWIVYAATPMMAIAGGKQANIRIAKGWMLGINVKQESVVLQWSY